MSEHDLLGGEGSNANNRRKSKKKRRAMGFDEEHEQELERMKWNTDVEDAFMNDMEKILPIHPIMDSEEQSEARQWLAENKNAMQENKQMDDSGSSKKRRSIRLCGRACGQFKEVIVPNNGNTKCNCEHFMTKGWCLDSMIFNLVEFKKMPPMVCREVDGISWERINEGWKNKLMSTMFDEPGEEWHFDNMYKTYLPGTDPLFSYYSIIPSVPVPWLTISSRDEMPTLGLGISKRPTTEPGKFQLKISSIAPQSSAKVLVGNVILKVNGVAVASDDGTLFNGETIDHVTSKIRQTPYGQIMDFAVLREYRFGMGTCVGG
jgi:hypothetical protein